jgi:hypothetical protein
MSGEREHVTTGQSHGHHWGFYGAPWETCWVCGVVRRIDDKNSECKGPVKVTLRESEAQP